MRNIIIMGVGRSGKTTLSKLFKEVDPECNIIHSDAIKWGIIRANGDEPKFREDILKQMEWEKSGYLQDVLIEMFVHHIRNHYEPVVLETGQVYLDYLLHHPAYKYIKGTTDIIVLGTGGKNKDERARDCRRHDLETDWTYKISEQELSDYASDWEKQDLCRIEECRQYHIPYYDTSGDRAKILNDICRKYNKVEL